MGGGDDDDGKIARFQQYRAIMIIIIIISDKYCENRDSVRHLVIYIFTKCIHRSGISVRSSFHKLFAFVVHAY